MMPVSNPGIVASPLANGDLPTVIEDGDVLIDHEGNVFTTETGFSIGYVDPPQAGAYWRVLIDQFYEAPTFHGINEIEMSLAPGGANLCTGGTASASKFLAGYPAGDAFDGDTSDGNAWLVGSDPGDDTDQWIQYQFTGIQEITAVRIHKTDHTLSGFGGSFPQDFRIQYSNDGITYATVATYTDQDWAGAIGDFLEFTF
jgi:hypothetical protein